ncbi:rCG28141 [Rattus norvegicus]|uniref:RCG28141 n=1 Tax=Rattus norvegicus TaxID=10116 RepID=A6IDU5_RAT|nr:rCG28141 [Rattus norvegicus]
MSGTEPGSSARVTSVLKI